MKKIISGIFGLGLAAFSSPLYACSVCFAGDNPLQARAITLSVIFLLATVGGILARIAWLGRTWAKRAKELAETSS